MTRKSLIREADRVFSIYVRKRGSTFGYNHCYTCGAYLPIDSLQAGHFISRRYAKVRWHPVNVWPQCNRCNVDLSGNLKVYEKKLASQFSQDAVDGLWILARNGDPVTEEYLRNIIKISIGIHRLSFECSIPSICTRI